MKRWLITFMFPLLGMSQAGAADFNITVPVDLSRIPVRYTQLQVKCWSLCTGDAQSRAYESALNELGGISGPASKLDYIAAKLFRQWDAVDAGPGPALPGYSKTVETPDGVVEVVGMGMSSRQIPSGTGELHTTVSIAFDTNPFYAPNNVRSYVCGMKLSTDGSSNNWEPRSLEARDLDEIVATATTPVLVSKGEFDNPAVDASQPEPSCAR